jgi:hypothetical protein
MSLLNQAKYAKHAGISKAAVSKLVSRGRLDEALVDNGAGNALIDSEVADRIRSEGIKPYGKKNPPKRIRPEISDDEKQQTIFDAGVPKCNNFTEAQKIDREYQAALRKLDLEQRQGKLIDAEQVEKDAYEIGRRVRDSVLSIPDRISASLAVINDESEIHNRLKTELRNALTGLAE